MSEAGVVRRRRSRAEAEALVAEFEASGLRREAYCQQRAWMWAREFWRQKPDDPIRKRLLATSYAGIGDVRLSGLHPDKALENYSAAFQVFGNSPTGIEDHDRLLIGFYLGKGRALNELGKQSEALESDRKAVALAEALVQRFPASLLARRALFLAYGELVLPLAGRDALNISDSSQAQVYARKALSIAQMLVGVDSKNAQAI